MKPHQSLSPAQQIFILVSGLLLIVCFAFMFQEDASDNGIASPISNHTAGTNSDQEALTFTSYVADQHPQSGTGAKQAPGQGNDGQKVELYDQGLQMSRGSYVIPKGWKLVQDLATDSYTGALLRNKLDILGPQGELIRNLGITAYDANAGMDLEQSWRQTVRTGLQDKLNEIILGDLKPRKHLPTNDAVKKYADQLSSMGYQLHYLEASLSGFSQGQAYQGVVRITHLILPHVPDVGTLMAGFALAPAKLFAQTLHITEQIDHSFEENPVFEQRVRQIQQEERRRNSPCARGVMLDFYKDNKTGTLKKKEDPCNRIWKDNYIYSTYYHSPGNKRSHQDYIDLIREDSSIIEPDNDQMIKEEGDQFDYSYHHKNDTYDPGVKADSLQDDWQEITPSRPAY
ncbi:hypothetical protein [Catalinimonas niigatensis]|uniref:hypothetical protein n=1 Tax=Catalinimonas niigatensis TaxID=1397264 RepID=UPI0026660DC8|nr:hypothetical protein [Catalinimonas niigatensis]WPP49747.1 hypothetical protein PZB72_24040 [Catalinimonas niigatensis]